MKLKPYSAFAVGESGVTINLNVPETSSEFNLLAKAAEGSDPCCDAAVDYNVFHGTLADFRYFFAELFQASVTKEFPDHPALKRKVKTVKRKGGDSAEVYDEAEVAYFRRALAELGALRGVDSVDASTFQPLADQVMELVETDDDSLVLESAAEGNEHVKLFTATGELTKDATLGTPKRLVIFDPTAKERGERGPKTLPKVYKAAADSIFTAGKADAFIEKYALVVTVPDGADEAKTKDIKVEAIGWKIKALEDAERAKVDLANKYA